MVRTFARVGFLALAVSSSAFAQNGDRVDQLEKEIQDLKLRLSKLESQANAPSASQRPAVMGEGWKSVSNWRKLTTGMSPSDVQKILGEPQRLDGGNLATWTYQNGGRVYFYDGKLDRWTEPRQ